MMKNTIHSTSTRVPYTADFVKRATKLFPENKKLHRLLKDGSWEVRQYLSDSMSFSFSPEELLELINKPFGDIHNLSIIHEGMGAL